MQGNLHPNAAYCKLALKNVARFLGGASIFVCLFESKSGNGFVVPTFCSLIVYASCGVTTE